VGLLKEFTFIKVGGGDEDLKRTGYKEKISNAIWRLCDAQRQLGPGGCVERAGHILRSKRQLPPGSSREYKGLKEQN